MSPRKNRDKRGGYVLMGDDASTSGKAATTLLWQDSEPTFGENAPVPRARAAAQNLPEFRPARQTPRSERREGMSAPKPQGETAPTARTPERRPRRQAPDMVFPDFDTLVSSGQQEKPSRRRSADTRDEEIGGRGFDPFAVDTGEPEFPEVTGRKTDRGTSHSERRTTSQSAAPVEPAFGSVNTGSARQRASGRDPLAAERAVRHGQSFGSVDDTQPDKKPLSFAFPTEETARARRQDFEFPEMPGTAQPAEDRGYSRSTGERPSRRRSSTTPRETTPETARPIEGSPVQDFLDAKSTQWTAGGARSTTGDTRGSDARKVSAGTGFLDLGMPTGGRPAEPKPEEDEPVFDFSTVDLSTLIPDDETQTDSPEKTPDTAESAPVKSVPDGWSAAPEVEIPEELLAQLAEEDAGRPREEVPATSADRKPQASAASQTTPTRTTETQPPPTYPEYPPPPKEKDGASATAAAAGVGLGLGLVLGFAGKRDRSKTTQPPATPPTPGKTSSSAVDGGSVKPPDQPTPEKKSTDRRVQDKKTPEKKSQDKKTPEKKTPEKKSPEKHTEKPAGSESAKPPGQKTPEYAATGRTRGMPIIGGVPVDPSTGKTTSDKTPETTTSTAAALRRRRPMMATTGQKLMILALGVALAFVLGILGGVVLSYGSWFTGGPNQTESSDATGDTGNTGDTEHQGGFIVPPESTDQTDSTDTTDSTDQTDSTDSTDNTEQTDSTDTTEPTDETDPTEETDPNGQSPGESRPDDDDPSQPTDPKPTDPKPTDPKPTEPKPTEPKPTEPKPTEPEPTEPKPTEPKPTEPEPTEPKPTEPQPTEPEPTDPPEEINPEDYFFHDADKRYLTEEDYKDLTDWELVLARNEIFARHGRRFATPEIQAYFDSCPWYKGTIDPEDFDISVLNKYERENIRILKAAGDARKEQSTDQDPEQLISDSNKRFLTQDDYQHLDDWELILARNEIFARHGRRFAIPEIQEYFDSLSWYQGTIEPEDFDSSVFNRYELENIRILKEEGEKRDKESGADQDSEYFFPDSDSRYLSKADYIDLTLWELILARNEIYARHGRKFSTPEIQEYFDGCSWYQGTIEPEDFSESVFNDYELQNIRLLKAASDAR